MGPLSLEYGFISSQLRAPNTVNRLPEDIYGEAVNSVPFVQVVESERAAEVARSLLFSS